VVGRRGIESLLTVARGEIEQSVARDYLQPALDRCSAGVTVVSVALNSTHAPQPVHEAFRDVASAAEDAERKVNEANEYRESVVREAAGARLSRLAITAGQAAERRARARGDSVAFHVLTEAYRDAPWVTRRRLQLEKLDAVLSKLTKYIDLTPAGRPGPEFWWRNGKTQLAPPFLPDSPSTEDSQED
jgi:membrane protease subunit HflK